MPHYKETLSGEKPDTPPALQRDREFIRHRLGILCGGMAANLIERAKNTDSILNDGEHTFPCSCEDIIKGLTGEIPDDFLDHLNEFIKQAVEIALEFTGRSPNETKINVHSEFDEAHPSMAIVTLRIEDEKQTYA